MTRDLPTYETATQLARRAAVHRCVVVRLWSQGHLTPRGWILDKGDLAPLFLPDDAVTVLQLQKITRKTTQQT